MKKAFKLIGIIAFIAIIGFTFLECKNDEPKEEPKFRQETISLAFGSNTYTATVKGTLLEAEWNGVANKIETALNNEFNVAGGPMKAKFEGVFSEDVIIIVEKTSEYSKYKVVNGKYRTLYLNFDVLNNNLQTVVTNGVTAMANEEGTTME